MANQELQTADTLGRVMLPATFAEAAVVVEILSPSEVRIRKVGGAAEDNTSPDDLMKFAETSGAFEFWNSPAEDIYGLQDGETS